MPTACGRSLTPAGYFFSALLLFLFLPACGGGTSGGGVQQPDVPGVIGLTVIPASGSLHLSWTNPNINSITGFNITWQRTHDATGNAVPEDADSHMKDDETNADARAAYRINGVRDNHNYTISVTVLTANKNSAAERLLDRVPGPNEDNDTIPDALDNCRFVANSDQADDNADGTGDVCEGDMDGDVVPDETDNCPADSNPQQEDVNNDGQGDACESSPAERPATEGVTDAVITPGEEILYLNWTNPAGFITAFNIRWVNADSPDDTGMGSIDAFREATNTNSETSTSFAISPLTNNTNYTLTIILTADADNSYATEVSARTGLNSDNDTRLDAADNCRTVANSDQAMTTQTE